MSDHIPHFEMTRANASRPGGFRRRLSLSCMVLCVACIVAAYVFPHPLAPDRPNAIWFFIAFWPGLVAFLIGFAGWLWTGRL